MLDVILPVKNWQTGKWEAGWTKPLMYIEQFLRISNSPIQVYYDIMWGKIKTDWEKEAKSLQIFNITWPQNRWHYISCLVLRTCMMQCQHCLFTNEVTEEEFRNMGPDLLDSEVRVLYAILKENMYDYKLRSTKLSRSSVQSIRNFTTRRW